MDMLDKRMMINQLIYDLNENVIFPGKWDPKKILQILKVPKSGSWKDKTVLDIGANTGGLSVEIARLGANVTMLEPDPLERSIGTSIDFIKEIIETENLKITIVKEGLFYANKLNQHDIILFLGLIYHFKYPQYCLDFISSLNPKELYISTQISNIDDLTMQNRLSGMLPKGHIPSQFKLGGYHPSHKLFRLMLNSAGFRNVHHLNDVEYYYPAKQFTMLFWIKQ